MNILATAKQKGSANVLLPVIKELEKRNHEVTIYATGNDEEAKAFKDLHYQCISPAEEDYDNLVKGYDSIIVGLSGYATPDGYFLRAANAAKIPSIAVQDQDSNYKLRLGDDPKDLPTILAVMDENCKGTIRKQLEKEIAEEAIKRIRVVGWTAFDEIGQLKKSFTEEDQVELLSELGLNPEQEVYLHCTQNVHPEARYMKRLKNKPYEEKEKDFIYETKVTEALFKVASDLGVRLTVKPHPGERFKINTTKKILDRFGFDYIPPGACDTKKLMLASYSVTAGKSTCLHEGCILDKNTGGILPDLKEEELSFSPAIALGAIPYTKDWKGIREILSIITSKDEMINKKLASDRKRFSVDGKASKRLVDLIESL